MKKVLRVLGILLLLLIVAAGVLIAFAPTSYTVERSVTIQAPQEAVFRPLSHFREWPTWTAWAEMDPTQKVSFGGNDGQAGSTYHWNGKDAGEGQMTATSVTDRQMNYNLDFIKPFEAHNKGWVRAESTGNSTVATMSMVMDSPRPMNAIGWLFKGFVEKDFEKGLNKLKAGVESGQLASQMP